MLIKKEQLPLLIKNLKKLYPTTNTALHYKNAFELLCAVILSAQCTDKRVNMVTPNLFAKYPDAKTMAQAKIEDIETIIKSTGFYHAKAKSLLLTSKKLTQDFKGQVPQTMAEMLSLHGVARKTANVVLSDFYGIVEGIVVDTHVKRLAYRIGFSNNDDPVHVEKDLMKLFPKEYWHWISHALIWHGRNVCGARKPDCAACIIADICRKNGLKTK